MPGLPLYDLVRSPSELLENPDLKLNYEYYVMKQIIPPLNRIMVLMNINCADWVRKLSFKPKIFQYLNDNQLQINPHQPITIANYIYSNDCVLCGCKKQDREGLCSKCSNLNQHDLAKLRVKFQKCERKYFNLTKVCQMCTYDWKKMKSGDCISLDCPNNFTCISAKQDLKKSNYIRKIIDNLF
jgi:DNA polymerase zeta